MYVSNNNNYGIKVIPILVHEQGTCSVKPNCPKGVHMSQASMVSGMLTNKFVLSNQRPVKSAGTEGHPRAWCCCCTGYDK